MRSIKIPSGWQRRQILWVSFVACLWIGASSFGQEKASGTPVLPTAATGPLATDEALKRFQLPPGLRIELVAAEPKVVDPVEIRFDEQGRMWVVEMGDYPHGPAAGEKPRSRIRILEDRDGDGRFETSTVFAEHLLFATGLQPWQGGVIVSLAGKVAFMQDTNGDGRADRQETWYEGFAQENSQLRANHPRWALDGHVYVANGLRGGSVVNPRDPAQPPVPLNNLDFRFAPFSGAFEALTGVGQFGLTFDDYGNRFICSNRNPLMHVVIEDRFLKRNPKAAFPELRHDVAAAGEQSRVFPLSRAWTTSNLHAGQFTAACGVHIYRGTRLPAQYYGAGFTCDPTGNLVHCEIPTAQGATYTSKPEREGAEFLASPDEWFRPVNCETGPDGALYIVDMYRAVIEHPDFVPEELKKRPDLMLGIDRGRIYRVVSSAPATAPQPMPSTATPDELVDRLRDPNAWQRETAARLLYQRQDPASKAKLVALATSDAPPSGRIAALWTLSNLKILELEVVQKLLHDPHPGVREQAVAVSETQLAGDSMLKMAIRKLAGDPDARVRFRVALMLTPASDDDDVQALAQIAILGYGDTWTRRAVSLAAGNRATEVLLRILRDAKGDELTEMADAQALLEELAATSGGASVEQNREFLRSVRDRFRGLEQERLRLNVMDAWLQSLTRSGKKVEDVTAQTDLTEFMATLFARATQLAQDATQTEPVRVEAMDLLAADAKHAPVVEVLAKSEPTQSVRIKAISLASRRADLEYWKGLLAEFGSSSPAIRRAVLEGTLARADRTKVLLDEVAAERIKVSELDQLTTGRLIRSGDAAIRERATKLLADAIPADRKKVLEDYQPVLQMAGDATLGRAIFAKHCATCHRIGDLGVNVAPDISDSRVKTQAQLLTDILQPNRAIDNNYISYVLVTTNGESLVGVVSSETATSVTLKMPEGKVVTMLRNQIEELRSTGISLMPEGLEKTIPPKDMADLITFVKHWRYLDGKTPLGK